MLKTYISGVNGGVVWAAIHARQRAQLIDEPGVRLPSRREPAAPVAEGTFAGTPSSVNAASMPNDIALRTSAGTPTSSVRCNGNAFKRLFEQVPEQAVADAAARKQTRDRSAGRTAEIACHRRGDAAARRSAWPCRADRANCRRC